MKILWVTNSILPDLAIGLNQKHPPYEGWLIGLANQLASNGINLTIATAHKNLGTFHHHANGIEYYLLETKTNNYTYDKYLEHQWQMIMHKTQPDLIHIQGSENAHGLSLLKTFPKAKYVLSIQGIISLCSRYYRAGLSRKEILRNLTIRNLIKRDSIISKEKEFINRSETIEKEYFIRINNFIGRTEWDKTHVRYLSENSKYHFCNEMLRPSFYKSTSWNISKVKKYSIFLSQGNYPLKGLHQVFKAVSLLKNDFPDIEVCFAGRDILLEKKNLMNYVKQKNYGKYLQKLIKKLKITDHVKYLGTLNETSMLEAYKKSNVFICPSSIENSPNSLAEAQILGVPCIASYVGGIPSMVENKKTGLLYRFEEVEQLAEHIRYIFTNPEKAIEIGERGRESALARHDKNTIVNKTISVYNSIIFAD